MSNKLQVKFAIMLYAKAGYPKGKSIRGFIKYTKESHRVLMSKFNKRSKYKLDRQLLKTIVRNEGI